MRNQQKNLAVAFYDYQNTYEMGRHDSITRVYQWMGVPEKVVNIIIELMEGWKPRLDVTEDGKVLKKRAINIGKVSCQETKNLVKKCKQTKRTDKNCSVSESQSNKTYIHLSFKGQLSYFPLICTFCSFCSNHLINKLQERALRITHNDFNSS